MNNDLKYIFRGILWVIVLFFAVSIIRYCYSYKEINSSDVQLIDIDRTEIPSAFSEGKNLFSANCAPCHSIYKNLTGPPLNGINERIPDKKLLYEWIRNSKKVLQSGNVYFNSLFKEYGRIEMTAFPDLTNDEIDKILAYINSENMQYSLPVSTVSK